MKIENGTSSILYTFNEFELNQHETEVRNKVIDEVLEWASYKINDYDTSIPRLEMINSFIKKLNDMKGGSDE